MNTDGDKNNLKFHLPAGELLERLQEYENLFSKISHKHKSNPWLISPMYPSWSLGDSNA